MTDRLGIDIGSKTIKLVCVAEGGQTVYESYARHRSKVKDALAAAVHDCMWRGGDREVQVCVTGSAGMRVAELLPIPFVQEVVALKRAVEASGVQADAVLEMGGEDTKLVYLAGVPEQRMNAVCAGGTGGFIDLMASLMGKRPGDMSGLARRAGTTYPIASRCAVFARSDVRPLLAAGARKEDVAASVLEAVCTQAVAGLSAGRPLEGTVVLLGGPFQHIPALRDAFCKVTGIDEEHAVVPDAAHLFVARGAAAFPKPSRPMLLSELEAAVRAADFSCSDGIGRLPALFTCEDEYERFRARHAGCRIPAKELADVAEGAGVFLGVDAGSTTLKMALVDENGAMLAWRYDWNEGDVAKSFPRMLGSMYREMDAPWTPRVALRRSCVVGYGEDFCRAAFGVDDGEVETVAHLRAALELDRDVDFIMDIGGQDIKCLYVRDGQIDDIVLNEACSSGCGSLFDAIARSMRCSKEAFSVDALFAEHPVDLGCRCTTFMESRVKHAQKEGASRADVAAGVVWACVRNALFKVVRRPGFPCADTRVMVQGGAFANDALLRAFEMECGVEVERPDRSELMGAWGAALLARDAWLAAREADSGGAGLGGAGLGAAIRGTENRGAENRGAARCGEAGQDGAGSARPGRSRAGCGLSGLLGPRELAGFSLVRHERRCGGCENRCKLTVSRFSVPGENGRARAERRAFVTGNRCERGAWEAGGGAGGSGQEMSAAQTPPPNMVKLKNALIVRCDADAFGSSRRLPVPTGRDTGAETAAGGDIAGGAAGGGGRTRPAVGVPKALALYESYPFWAAFFKALGCRVVAGADTSEELYRRHMDAIAVEGACHPSKLLFTHAAHLAQAGAELLFVPDMGGAFARAALLGGAVPDGLVECPLVERAGTMLARNMHAPVFRAVKLATPDLSGMRTFEEAAETLRASLAGAGLAVGADELEAARRCGQAAYRAFFDELACRSADALARADAGEFPVAVLAGHPYHADPGIGHGIDGLLGQMGYAVVEQGVLDTAAVTRRIGAGEGFGAGRQPVAQAGAEAGGDAAGGERSGGKGQAGFSALSGATPSPLATLEAHRRAQLVVLRSFGCGMDAMRADDLREDLHRAGRPFAEIKLDQISDLAAVRIRLRSLAYAARAARRKSEASAGKGAGGAESRDKGSPASVPPAADASAAPSAAGAAIVSPGVSPSRPLPATPVASPTAGSAPADGGALLVPGVFGELGEEVARLMRARGFTTRLLPDIDGADMAAGLALVDNDACNIAVALVGHYARALDARSRLSEDTAAGTARLAARSAVAPALLAPELCHDCRQVALPELLSHALARAGHPPMRLVEFSTAELRGACPAADAPRLSPERPAIGVCGTAPTLMNGLFTKTVFECLEKAGCRAVTPPLCDITCEKDFLSPALDFFESCGVRDVICIACFGCLGAHVFARGALRHMQRLHPGISLSVLDYDAGASEVNLVNRVELVVQSAMERHMEKARPRP